MAIKIKVSPKFNGERGGVKFVNGIGIFEDEEKGKNLALSFGYEIVEDKKESKEEKEDNKEEAPKKAASTRKKSTKKVEE